MKSTKKIINAVNDWALEICMEDGHHLLQQVDGVIPDGEHITLHICDKNYSKLASIEVHKIIDTVIFLSDDDKCSVFGLCEYDDGFELMKNNLISLDSEFFTSDRLAELSRRLNDLPEKEEKVKYKSDDIKEISDPNKHTTLMSESDIIEIVRRWVCDICHESRFNLLHRHDTDGVGFDLIRPVSGFYRVTVVVKKRGNVFDIVISDIIPGGVARVMCNATGEVGALISGSFKLITHEQIKDLINRLRCSINNSTPVKDSCSFSLPKVFTRPLNKIKPTTLTHDIIDKASRSGPGWYFDTTSIPDKYDVLDADTQYRRRINYLIDKFRRLSAEYGRAESALSKIPNIPLEEYCTRKFPIRRKLILPTVETIDGKTVMYFKVDDLSERVIKKYHNKHSILLDAVDKELDSKNSMFNIFDQGTCTRPSDEVLCYIIENMASRNPYGIKAVPNKIFDYCSLEKILVLLNLSSAELKGIAEDEMENMVEYLNRHDSLTQYGGGTTVNGILTSLMYHIDATDRTLEHNVVVIDNSSILQAAVKITQLINMLINCDITLGWMKNHKGEREINDPDPTLVDKVAACLRK